MVRRAALATVTLGCCLGFPARAITLTRAEAVLTVAGASTTIVVNVLDIHERIAEARKAGEAIKRTAKSAVRKVAGK